MLFSFFFAYSFGARVPMEEYFCGANINGYSYNASEMAERMNVIKFSDQENKYDFYLQFCKDLEQQSLPDGVKAQFGASGMIVKKETGEYEPFEFHYAHTYSIPNAYEDGFFIYSHTESYKKILNQKLYYLVYDMKCDETSDDINPLSYQVTPFDDSLAIIITFKNKYGCPKEDVVPPEPENHYCNMSYPSNFVYPFGVSVELNKLNSGPRGFPIPINENKIALLKTCGQGKCPPGAVCDREKAGIWVCTKDGCKAFGNFPRIEYDDPYDYITAVYDDIESKTVYLTLACDFSLADGMTDIIRKKINYDAEFKIFARTNLLCAKPLEQISPLSCQARLNDKIGNTIDIDLTKFNFDNGYRFNASIPYLSMDPKNTYIQYQPCAPTTCAGDVCKTTGATVWLCQINEDGDSICKDYGLYSNSVSISAYTPSDLRRGLILEYKGSSHSSTIKLMCNQSVPSNTITFDETVSVKHGNELLISAYSSDICIASPTQSPEPIPTQSVEPIPTQSVEPIPTQSVEPIPTQSPEPIPTQSPRPSLPIPTPYVYPTPAPGVIPDLSFHNENYDYDLNEISIKKTYVTLDVVNNDELQNVVIFFENGIKGCPKGYECIDTQEASIYKCWETFNQEEVKKCFAIADVRYGINISGGQAIYKGGYGNYETHVTFNCKKDTKNNWMELSQNGKEENRVVYLDGYSKAFCVPNASVSKGMIFLLIVLIIMITYLSFGTFINLIKDGQIDLPNREFWTKFGQNIIYAIKYITSCKKDQKYDKI